MAFDQEERLITSRHNFGVTRKNFNFKNAAGTQELVIRKKTGLISAVS